MAKVLELVRKDAFKVLVEKLPERKRHEYRPDLSNWEYFWLKG
jgi:hypothetical protein